MKTALPSVLFVILAVVPAASAQDSSGARAEMSELPDAGPGWDRIGEGHAFLLDDGTLAVNDNSNSERIAFQSFIDDATSKDELSVRASVRVISNLGGAGSTLELARPGLELILRLYPDHLVLGERDAQGDFSWLGQASLALDRMVELELRKTAAAFDASEQVLVLVDGVEILRVEPRALGGLGIGRVLFGSLSNNDMGATIWDWLEWERTAASGNQPPRQSSFGALKAYFGN